MNNYKIQFDLDFKRNTHKGLYVAFEGIDGAGKTVQLENVAEFLKVKDHPYTVIQEPRRTGPVGRLINDVLQGRAHLPATAIQYLFCADRISQQQDIILPALKRAEAVLSHRCFWSAVPYGLMDWIDESRTTDVGYNLMVAQSILSLYYQHTIPDVTFYLDVSADTAIKRIQEMGTTPEYYEKKEKLEKVREGYRWMIEKFPDEFVVIDAERDVESVKKEIGDTIEKLLTEKKESKQNFTTKN